MGKFIHFAVKIAFAIFLLAIALTYPSVNAAKKSALKSAKPLKEEPKRNITWAGDKESSYPDWFRRMIRNQESAHEFAEHVWDLFAEYKDFDDLQNILTKMRAESALLVSLIGEMKLEVRKLIEESRCYDIYDFKDDFERRIGERMAPWNSAADDISAWIEGVSEVIAEAQNASV